MTAAEDEAKVNYDNLISMRDLLIETRADVRHLTDSVTKLTVTLDSCTKDHETRIRNIEINGSVKTEEVAQGLAVVEKSVNKAHARIDDLEVLNATRGGKDKLVDIAVMGGISFLIVLLTLFLNHNFLVIK